MKCLFMPARHCTFIFDHSLLHIIYRRLYVTFSTQAESVASASFLCLSSFLCNCPPHPKFFYKLVRICYVYSFI